MTRIGTIALAIVTTLALVACDPKTPVQTSDISTQVDQKIAAHNADANAHANLNITSGQLTDQIPNGKIADGAITSTKIGTGAVGSTQLAAGSVTAPAIAQGAVQTASIGDLMVTTAKLADLAVTAAKIGNGTITTTQISATAGITGGQLANATITATQIANATITATQIANNTITNGQIANNTIMAGQIANNTITATQIANNTITAGQIANATITTTQIAAAAGITGGQLASGTVTDTNLKSFSSGREIDNNAAHIFYSMTASNATPNFYLVLECGGEGGTAGTIVFRDNNSAVTTITCPANSGTSPELFRSPATGTQMTQNNHVYTLDAKAGAANSAVAWRGVVMMTP